MMIFSFTDEFLEFAVKCSSQYDDTTRNMARELLEMRKAQSAGSHHTNHLAEIEFLQLKIDVLCEALRVLVDQGGWQARVSERETAILVLAQMKARAGGL